MSWVKLDDQFFSHPKAREAGRDGALLFLAGLTYCARHLTDGKIPKTALGVVAAEAWTRPSFAARLVEVGLWHDMGDHYLAHDYLDRNPTRAKVLGDREAARERASKGARSSHEVRAKNGRASRAPVPVPDVPTEHDTPAEPAKNGKEPKRGYTKAERDPIFSALVEVFGEPKTKTTRGFYGASVTELLDAEATAPEVIERGRCLQAKGWPDCTPKALLKHWGSLANGHRPAFDPDKLSRSRT